MFGMQVMIEKDCVIRLPSQQLLSLLYIIGYINKITLEANRKPLMPSFVIVQKKYSYRMPLSVYVAETKLTPQ